MDKNNFAVGRVITGFTKPYVALYSASGGTLTYTKGREMARGVDVDVAPEFGNGKIFYANNGAAEKANGTLTGGKLNLTVDGLFTEVERMISGLPEAGSDGWTPDGDDRKPPYVGTGFIVRWQSNGEIGYTPVLVSKVQYDAVNMKSKTQEEEIDYQTQALTATILRDDTPKHNWRYLGDDFATEEEAEAALKTKMNITGGGA